MDIYCVTQIIPLDTFDPVGFISDVETLQTNVERVNMVLKTYIDDGYTESGRCTAHNDRFMYISFTKPYHPTNGKPNLPDFDSSDS